MTDMSEFFHNTRLRDDINELLKAEVLKMLDLDHPTFVHLSERMERESSDIIVAKVHPYGDFLFFDKPCKKNHEIAKKLFRNKTHERTLFKYDYEIELVSEYDREIVRKGFSPVEQYTSSSYVRSLFQKTLDNGLECYVVFFIDGNSTPDFVKKHARLKKQVTSKKRPS